MNPAGIPVGAAGAGEVVGEVPQARKRVAARQDRRVEEVAWVVSDVRDARDDGGHSIELGMQEQSAGSR
jgi:hypothetical protein